MLCSVGCSLTHNGPAIWGGCVTRRKHRAGTKYFSSASWRITVQGGYGVVFANPGTSFLRYTSVAVQVLLRAGNMSRCASFKRRKVRGPGLSYITKLSKYLNTNAKNVTNLLILLSVLGLGEILELSGCDQFVSIRLCIIFSQVGVASAPL
jgi:hypothetical protein